MKQCANCGAVLPEGEQTVCLVCGARQPEQPAVQHTPPHGQRPRKKNPDKLLFHLLIVLAVLVVVLLIGTATTYMMYNRFNADDTYDAIGAALLSSDTAALQELVAGDGVEVTEAGLKALCRAFTTQDSVDALIAQLKAQAAGTAAELSYPALSPVSNTVFLGYKSHKLLAKPVSLRVSSAAQNALLNVDGTSVTGETDENGTLYKAFFPGVYTCTVSGQTALGDSITGQPTEVALFDPENAVLFDGNLPIANITVAGCLSDDALISVNGTQVEQRPVSHTVSLPQVAVGSTISLSYTTPYGSVTTASVQFTDRAVTALQFETYTTEGGVPEESDLVSLVGAFYASYLDALNNRDVNRITTCTDALRGKLAADATNASANTVYVFDTAKVDRAHAAQSFIDDGTPTLTLNAVCSYTSNTRGSDDDKNENKKNDKKETDYTVYYTIEFVYTTDGWRANRLAESTADNWNAGTLSPIEG